VVPTLSACAPHLTEALAETWMHAALADERQRLRTVLDQLPEGVILVEAQSGKVSYANPAAAGLLGYALPHLVGAPLNQSAMMSPYRFPPAHQQSAFRWNFALIHALWGKIIVNEEIVVSRPDGSEIVVLSSAAPIRASNGLITEAVMVFHDITAKKQLEQQKNEFFVVANHELRRRNTGRSRCGMRAQGRSTILTPSRLFKHASPFIPIPPAAHGAWPAPDLLLAVC